MRGPAAEQGIVAQDRRPASARYWHMRRIGRYQPSERGLQSVVALEGDVTSAGRRIPHSTTPEVQPLEPPEKRNLALERFRTNLLRKRRTYNQYLSDCLLPGGYVWYHLLRIQLFQSLTVRVVELQLGKVYEVGVIDRVKCSREEKEMLRKYAIVCKRRVSERCRELQSAETRRVNSVLMTLAEKNEGNVDTVMAAAEYSRARRGVVPPSGTLGVGKKPDLLTFFERRADAIDYEVASSSGGSTWSRSKELRRFKRLQERQRLEETKVVDNTAFEYEQSQKALKRRGYAETRNDLDTRLGRPVKDGRRHARLLETPVQSHSPASAFFGACGCHDCTQKRRAKK